MDQILFNRLNDEVVVPEDSGELCAAADGAMLPVWAKLMLTLVLTRLKDASCEQKDQILATVEAWVRSKISNTVVADVIIAAAQGAVYAFCGE